MSSWTYVKGIIEVDVPGRTQHEIEYILNTILDHLPKVTGSEEDMEIHTVKRYGTSCSSSCNEFQENMLYRNKKGWLETQSRYYLVLDGNLRDRVYEETYKEFLKFLLRLAKRLLVMDILVEIDGYNKKKVIDDAYSYNKMYEWPSWRYDEKKKESLEPAWWEYLMWDRAKGSSYPIKLEYKYYDNEENDKEVERRMRYENG